MRFRCTVIEILSIPRWLVYSKIHRLFHQKASYAKGKQATEPQQGLIEDFEVGGGGRYDCEQGDAKICKMGSLRYILVQVRLNIINTKLK